MIAREDFVATVLRCVGTPFGHMGRTIGRSLDCAGVVWAALRECGSEAPETIRYRLLPTGDEAERGLLQFADRVDAGDGWHLWQVPVGRHPRHIVVPVGDGYAVHSHPTRKVVVYERWTGPLHACWRLREVT